MIEAITLLKDFGFTAREAEKIAKRAYENNLSLTDIQAWIDEARASTSLHNPLGFVRARLQDGDKLPTHILTDPHIANRHRYQTQWDRRRARAVGSYTTTTQTCKCGHIIYKTHICPECGMCPTCCECPPEETNEE